MAGTAKLTGENLADALKLLEASARILNRAKVPYSLDAGTLLGVMREDRLLPWDTDMDLAVPSTHSMDLIRLKRVFQKAGYIVRYRFTRQACGPIPAGKLRLVRLYSKKHWFLKKEQLMDIFIKYKVKNNYYWTLDSKDPVLQYCPAQHLDELLPHIFNGVSYSIPKDYEAYLRHHYGDWRLVVKEWDFRKDDLCIADHTKWKKLQSLPQFAQRLLYFFKH